MPHEIIISDVIGATIFGEDFGVTAKSVRAELEAAGDEDVLVRINSPGGSVFEAAAIFNLLSDHGVDVEIDGLAASAASIISMAGRKVTIAENAMMMIHNPHGVVVGGADDARKMAEILDKIKDTLVDTYRNKSSLKKAELSKMMDSETWFTASEAKEAGLADEIKKPVQVDARFDLEQFGFKNVPADWPPKPVGTPKRDAALEKLQSMLVS